MARYTRFIHTVRYLKARQIGWRLYYRFMRRQVVRQALKSLQPALCRSWKVTWSSSYWMPACQIESNAFMFLGEQGRLDTEGDWNDPKKSKLWLYNLHYLDELGSLDAAIRFESHFELVKRWVDENPPLAGNGWEPYPLSLRLVNLVKWLGRSFWQGETSIPNAWLDSLARQAQALSAQREYHILANHLFANGKALTFVGTFLQGKDAERWLSQGLTILDAEIPEQFLKDGGHFERSPMYHATLLWDMADLVHLAECSGLKPLCERATKWRAVFSAGLTWLKTMSHPDGDIGFFNDATFGIAPSLADLQRYADFLGIKASQERALHRLETSSHVVAQHATSSGYLNVSWLNAEHCALLDTALVGPDYQPGHAHADTLSFELSLFGQRVLVNSGISQYGDDAERHRQRSTAAHNTVVVDGENSSEVWAGFRVARRAKPGTVHIEQHQTSLWVVCNHDGYRRLPGRAIHQREWFFEREQIIVRDQLKGRFYSAEARFHFHPDITVALENSHQVAAILPNGKRMVIALQGGAAHLETSTWHPRFGVAEPNTCLVATFTGTECTTKLCWAK